ncbi:hypothetical protein Ahy_B08g094279 [Arachis hypogaea]|uniref:PB1-like domain-containing protein n=1 Tax=Arachis hypogaea TaxID=3818 RepID=A0A444Y8E5_ARAHY|nr:hypothetical protein Ahy_B08g094279 [Arachis hypogaea]
MGVDPNKSNFVAALYAKFLPKSMWNKKVELYKSFGLTDDNICEAFVKHPFCMLKFVQKIEACIGFFVKELGWEPAEVTNNSVLLSLDLDKRVVPRAAVAIVGVVITDDAGMQGIVRALIQNQKRVVLGVKRACEFGLLKRRDVNSQLGSTHRVGNGPLQYVGGETTVIKDTNSDRWSVFEAYAELKQFGYVEENISALWFKDPTHEDMEKILKLFKGDADSIAMCKIAELRDYVELYVVHKVEEEDVFSAAGYIDVEKDHGMVDKSEGQELVVYGGEQAGRNQSKPGADDSGVETRDSDDDVNQEAEFGHSGDSDSLDSEYKPSEEEDDNKDDLHFTECEYELDPDGNGAMKKKGVTTENLDNEEGANSDELDLDHEVGVEGSDSDHQGVRYPVHKAQKDMNQYK